MKGLKRLLFALAALLMVSSAYADEIQDGEYVGSTNGVPTPDHFFTRNDYTDLGVAITYDDVVSFKSGNLQLVWIYLDDDAIYENQAVQALTPSEYAAGKPYHEITYYSFQTYIYLPDGIEMVSYEDDDGNVFDWQKGDRMPKNAQFSYWKRATTTIDGLNYNVFELWNLNMTEYCTHFSSRTATLYEANGALKKNYKLFGIYLKNTMNEPQGRLGDMIFAQTLLCLKETSDIYFYGTGGNGV